MTLGDVIYQYRMNQHMSQRAFAAKCGVSNVYINMLEKNLNPSTGKPIAPSALQLKAIANAMGYTLDEITQMTDSDSKTTSNETKVENAEPIPGYSRAPYSQKPVPKGDKTRHLSSVDPKREAKRKVIPLQLESISNPHGEKTVIDADLTITVTDDSMYPTYLKNDILFIKSQEYLGFDGQIMAVMIDATSTLVRHIHQDPRGEGLMFVSDNPSYPTEYKAYKDFPEMRLVGWVCGFARLYDLEKWYERD